MYFSITASVTRDMSSDRANGFSDASPTFRYFCPLPGGGGVKGEPITRLSRGLIMGTGDAQQCAVSSLPITLQSKSTISTPGYTLSLLRFIFSA